VRFLFPFLAIFLFCAPASAQSMGKPMDLEAVQAVLSFLGNAKKGKDTSADIAENAILSSTLGAATPYNGDLLEPILADCDLVLLSGSEPLEASDSASYLWAGFLCSKDGRPHSTLLLGFSVEDSKISNIHMDDFASRPIDEEPTEFDEEPAQ
jgi:hypothetical protein